MPDEKTMMPSELGVHELGKLKVKSVSERNTKTNWVEFEGLDKKCVVWKESKYPPATPLEEGNEDVLTVEVKEETDNRDGSTYTVAWVKSFGKKAGGNGGGGGKGYVPKSREEIHAASVCGVVKSGLEYCGATQATSPKDVEAILRIAVDAYIEGMQKIGGAGQ